MKWWRLWVLLLVSEWEHAWKQWREVMAKRLLVVLCVWGVSQTAWAWSDITLHQSEHQDQDQVQRQTQWQVAEGGSAKQKQSVDQANGQTVTQDIHGQGRNLVQSSPVLVVGQAQEGIAVGTPFANASLAKMSEVSRLTECGTFIAANADHPDSRVQDLENQCVKAAKRCGLICHVWRLLN